MLFSPPLGLSLRVNCGNSAGCYQTALKTLWTTTDTNIKQKYEEQARQQGLNVDISRNQRKFEDNIGGTLQNLCTNGALGLAEMILLASFRNSAGERVTIADLWPTLLQQSFPAFAACGMTLALRCCPCCCKIARAGQLFPEIKREFRSFQPSTLITQVVLGLYKLLIFSFGSLGVYATVPYADIAACPNNFYDMERFSLRLDKPLTEMTLSQLSGIIEYLISTSATSDPFVFHAKHDILAHRRAATEALHTPSPPPGPISVAFSSPSSVASTGPDSVTYPSPTSVTSASPSSVAPTGSTSVTYPSPSSSASASSSTVTYPSHTSIASAGSSSIEGAIYYVTARAPIHKSRSVYFRIIRRDNGYILKPGIRGDRECPVHIEKTRNIHDLK
ncbi:hypothetical protein B0H14DRAFT_2624512 [Mycena olivaceomarginata]|nr:hypothetical protein B0H14DRAFT_2624512 [Mycena olivaceomarginata]